MLQGSTFEALWRPSSCHSGNLAGFAGFAETLVIIYVLLGFRGFGKFRDELFSSPGWPVGFIGHVCCWPGGLLAMLCGRLWESRIFKHPRI